MKKTPTEKNNPKIKVSASWKRTIGEPSPGYIRLWQRILTSIKETTTNARLDADNGELKKGMDLPNSKK